MLNLNILASGSSGNSYCIETDSSFIFVDIGISCRKVENIIDKDLNSKDLFLFITHEHRDHIAGYKTFYKKYKPKVYCTEGTADYMYDNGFDVESSYIFKTCNKYELDNFKFEAFDIHHDAIEPVGYRFDFNDLIITFATDLGIVDELAINYLSGSDTLILESNYEDEILKKGKYPPFLKKRILSSKGHLSNKDALNLISQIADTGISQIYLSHISDENNDYKLVNKYADFIKKHYSIKTDYVCRGGCKKNINLDLKFSELSLI